MMVNQMSKITAMVTSWIYPQPTEQSYINDSHWSSRRPLAKGMLRFVLTSKLGRGHAMFDDISPKQMRQQVLSVHWDLFVDVDCPVTWQVVKCWSQSMFGWHFIYCHGNAWPRNHSSPRFASPIDAASLAKRIRPSATSNNSDLPLAAIPPAKKNGQQNMLPISGYKECMYADLLQVLQGASVCVCVHACFQHIRKEKLCNTWQEANIQTRAIKVRLANGTSNTKAGYVFCSCPNSQLIVEVGGWIWNSGTGVVTSNEAASIKEKLYGYVFCFC